MDSSERKIETEREAYSKSDPDGFFYRPPPAAHEFQSFITTDDDLFQTIHMGAAVVDIDKWVLVVDGMVEEPLTFTLKQLHEMPQTTITSFHECYGSPIKPPTSNVWRIGNVRWTGVRLQDILSRASPLPGARYVHTEGLDRGEFAGIKADRYQKDVLIEKAMSPEALIAYKLNGQPLSRKRGGPVRLIIPGWFGTNSTKWLCRLSLRDGRAQGLFTTKFYNEEDPNFTDGRKRPVWAVEPNSLITKPANNTSVQGTIVEVEGWAWSCDAIRGVRISVEDGMNTVQASVDDRVDFSWQKFHGTLVLQPGSYVISACATSTLGHEQPSSGRRNHVHKVQIVVV